MPAARTRSRAQAWCGDFVTGSTIDEGTDADSTRDEAGGTAQIVSTSSGTVTNSLGGRRGQLPQVRSRRRRQHQPDRELDRSAAPDATRW